MIDLHTHTTYSDGTDDVITLLKNAEKSRLEVLSITDHVTCKAYEELKHIDIKQYYTGKIIKGCELYSTIEGQTIELLAYNMNTDIFNELLPTMYCSETKDNKWQAKKLLQICKDIGIYIDYDNLHINYETQFCGLVSGGSDYHADNKSGTKLGIGKGNLNIPIEILDDWNI